MAFCIKTVSCNLSEEGCVARSIIKPALFFDEDRGRDILARNSRISRSELKDESPVRPRPPCSEIAHRVESVTDETFRRRRLIEQRLTFAAKRSAVQLASDLPHVRDARATNYPLWAAVGTAQRQSATPSLVTLTRIRVASRLI